MKRACLLLGFVLTSLAFVGCSQGDSNDSSDSSDTNAYTITFNANGGTGTMAVQAIVSGVSAHLTSNAFTYSGHTFAGWATSASGSVVYADSDLYTMGTKNVTLYAVWTVSNFAPTSSDLTSDTFLFDGFQNYIETKLQYSNLTTSGTMNVNCTSLDTILNPTYTYTRTSNSTVTLQSHFREKFQVLTNISYYDYTSTFYLVFTSENGGTYTGTEKMISLNSNTVVTGINTYTLNSTFTLTD